MRNMDEKTKQEIQEIWPFIIQLPTVCLGPIAFGYTIIQSLPTAGPQDPSSWASWVGTVYFLILFYAFPAGLIAFIHIRRHAGALGNLEKTTKVLAIINMIMGALMIGLVACVFIIIIAAVFSGVTA